MACVGVRKQTHRVMIHICVLFGSRSTKGILAKSLLLLSRCLVLNKLSRWHCDSGNDQAAVPHAARDGKQLHEPRETAFGIKHHEGAVSTGVVEVEVTIEGFRSRNSRF